MRIFLTGATGYIGSALAQRLSWDGHEVVALTRDAQKASRMTEHGLIPVVGDLREPDSWRHAADGCEALIHLGFEYGGRAAQVDQLAVEELLASGRSARAPRVLIYTSGVWVLGSTRAGEATEDDAPNPPEIVSWRTRIEDEVLASAGNGLSVSVVRPGCVYGESGGLYGMMIQDLLTEREIRLVGDGTNRWASVYLDDLIDLYALILEYRPRRGLYHAVDGSHEPIRAAAEAFVEAAGGGEVLDWPITQARRALGPLADALAMDQCVTSAKAERELGWRPKLTSVSRNADSLLAQWRAKSSAPCVA